MVYKTIADLDLKGKRVLLRIDINSEVIGNKVQDNPRFLEHSKTIKLLLKKKAVVVILAHQSRPGKKEFTSLKQHAKILNEYVKVKFVDEVIGKKALREIEKLKSGQALLLENVRFLKSEFDSKNNLLARKLKVKFDYFVNDAFSVMHRNQSSITDFPKIIESAIGPNVEKELKHLDELKHNLKNAIFILGGDKPKSTMLLMNHHKVLTTGSLSLLSLMAKGHKLGKQEITLGKKKELIPRIKKFKGTKVPIDLAIKVNGKRKEIDVKDLPTKYSILDIGKKTIAEYKKEINKAKAIFFKGSAGKIEDPLFCLGTKELLKAIAKTSGFKVISGGSSNLMIKKFKINKNSFNHVSLSGGALVYYLAGKKLPGLEVLR